MTSGSILVVDEDIESLNSIEAALQDTGGPILRARSGSMALQLATECDELAVLLIAASMSSMSGFECAERLRECPRFSTTPIVFVTNTTVDPRGFRGSQHGVVDHILSPVDPLELRSKISALLGRGVQLEPHADPDQVQFAKLEKSAKAFTHEVGNLLNNMYLQAQLLERLMLKEGAGADPSKRARLQLIMGEMQRLTTLLTEFQGPWPGLELRH
ncbi:Two-component hybrid sensor and regulator [Enhygromyxa salina]|uniref:Two-component hybrid sensor and regulator n=1 Tax=Enhygromyxa salina TaxID=215803 RepID=A0A0C2CR41_9BACT|nr:response regulator [Enhygromyxa salina]KIG13641.1 Two-component hybrid sensor and regulator [Enhygromyxa salina]